MNTSWNSWIASIEQSLVARRDEQRISQTALSQMIGVSQPAIATLESGRATNIEIKAVARYAAALGGRVGGGSPPAGKSGHDCVDLDREPQARCWRDLGVEAIDDAVSGRAPLARGRAEQRIEPATPGGHDGAEWAWRHRDEVAVVRVAEWSGEDQVVACRRAAGGDRGRQRGIRDPLEERSRTDEVVLDLGGRWLTWPRSASGR
ncbi:MAG: helix-turn-helix transcriptional regulator [Candidatus Rokubacteria bacterium]|nr:helix-turn-helix transcriptional regulator [Candidatus Rokubacteria bacterium]